MRKSLLGAKERISLLGSKDAPATPAPPKWDASKMPSQQGKIAIVTGANSGLGFITALELARHGANVILACRSEEKGLEAVKRIEEELALSPETAGSVEFRELDLSSLVSVKAFADKFKRFHNCLDLLVNNAGIMAVPYAVTEDGVESQFATNHLGHFALTAQLFYSLRQSKNARIVNVSSLAHRRTKMDLNTPVMSSKEKYNAMNVYNSTKLYNLLFTLELQRRIEAQGIKGVTCVAAHPGVATTGLNDNVKESGTWLMKKAIGVMNYLPISQKAEVAALSQIYAATDRSVVGGKFYGPDKRSGGNPNVEDPAAPAKSEENAKKLWDESERLARLRFEPLA
jgi:NAD(P)-dependent dehydrogenase (short-subunit alcohol dehydrogenase family)